MPAPSIIMALVALASLVVAVGVVVRPTPTEASVYRHRIAATVLLALAAMLGIYAWAMHGWEAAA